MSDTSRADSLVEAIQRGDVRAIERLVAADSALASAPLGGRHGTRTPLHVVADWPGFWPNGPQVVRTLLAAGADPNARDATPGAEAPLHWAASSDDADVARALIDGGADIELAHGSIGAPLDNAVGYGCWNVARLLEARGARIDSLWVAAALGNLDRLLELLDAPPARDHDGVSQAFWHACHAGQRRAAELLLQSGADINWIPPYAHRTPLDAAGQRSAQQQNVLTWLLERGAEPAPDAR